MEGGKRPSHQTRSELEAKGIKVTAVQDAAACLSALESDRNHTLILDLDLHRGGVEVVQKVRAAFPDVVVLVMASLERLRVVDDALKQGAWDFVIKQPDLSHLQEIPQAISRGEEKKRLLAEAERQTAEAQRLRAETAQYQGQLKELKAVAENYGEERKRAQAETERRLEETSRLQTELEQYRDTMNKLQVELQRSHEEQQATPRERPQTRERNGDDAGQGAVDEVLADIAEDLKSPLAAMIGYLEIASTISPEQAEPNQILSIQRINSLARRLFDLVMNHTGALDIEAGKFDLQKSPFEVNQILEMVVQDKQAEASTKKIDLALEAASDLPAILVDAVQLGRALGIMISNAINLSPLAGSVLVSSRLQGNEIAIAVKDSGAGIFEEEFALLFDRKKKFRRRGADVNTVGLFVARHIVAMHGGKIDVNSDPVEGTTLTISLPI